MMNVRHRCDRVAGSVVLIVSLWSMAGGMSTALAADDGPVTNVRVTEWNDATATLTFDVAWKHSWRHEGNHDALWVFFKYRPEAGEEWRHVRLAADGIVNPTGYGHAAGTRLDLIVPDGDDGHTGLLVRRADFGIGDVTTTGVTVRWDLASARGLPADRSVAFRGFGIEMAFVPEGSYLLGDGGTEPGHFCEYTDGSHYRKPYRVTGAGPIPTGRQPGRLWARHGHEPEDGGSIPAGFPNGFKAFYSMKGHAMGPWHAFVGSLPPAEAERFEGTTPNKHGGLSWAEGAAFAAWAGLRPMTELEYEKLSRGPIEPGWDTGDTLDHPSFWGVFSINGWRLPRERAVTVANAAGRAFRGTHGRGSVVPPDDWPRSDAVGAGIRGGHGALGNPADRRDAAVSEAVGETDRRGLGWRGVRTAPRGVGL